LGRTPTPQAVIRRFVFVVALFAPACSSAPNKRSISSQPECTGDRTVIVSNRSNREADVVAERKSGGTPYELGTVQPGRQEEITLPPDANNAYTRFPQEGRTSTVRGKVDLRYGCRT
jgi:hypothetical protein